jgi:hypothetical protein
MRLVECYSHLNGHEHILVHKPAIWSELQRVIKGINAEACKTKVSREKTMLGRMLYSPTALNRCFKAELTRRNWTEAKTSYWVTADQQLIRKTMQMRPEQQKAEIIAAGKQPIFSYNQTDFVKDRIELEVQFGKYAFVAYDLFVKHMAFYIGDLIDVGIEVLPMKELQVQMSSGVAYYEGELYNVLRQGRNTPAVPLVLLGVAV